MYNLGVVKLGGISFFLVMRVLAYTASSQMPVKPKNWFTVEP